MKNIVEIEVKNVYGKPTIYPAPNAGNERLHHVSMPLTYAMYDGRIVLAKPYKGEIYPVTYANVTMATRKSGEMNLAGFKAWVTGNRPYFVTFEAVP